MKFPMTNDFDVCDRKSVQCAFHALDETEWMQLLKLFNKSQNVTFAAVPRTK